MSTIKFQMNERSRRTRRRTEITIETHSVTIIRINGRQRLVRCESCAEPVTAFPPKQVAEFLRLDLTEVCRRIDAKQIHLTNDDEVVAMVCGNSLGDTQSMYKGLFDGDGNYEKHD